MSKLANTIVSCLSTHNEDMEAEYLAWANRVQLDKPITTRQGVRDLGGNDKPRRKRETCKDEQLQAKLDRDNDRRRKTVQKEKEKNAHAVLKAVSGEAKVSLGDKLKAVLGQ